MLKELTAIINSDNDTTIKVTKVKEICKVNGTEELGEFLEKVLYTWYLPNRISSDFNAVYCIKKDTTKNYLISLSETIVNKLYLAIINESLWRFTNNNIYADKAIAQYYNILFDNLETYQICIRICSIYKRFRSNKIDYNTFFNKCITYVYEHRDDDDFCIMFIIDSLLYVNIRNEEIIDTINKLICHYQSVHNYKKSTSYLERLIEIKGQKKSELYKILAKDYESWANDYDKSKPENSQNIVSLMHRAMEFWGKTNSTIGKKERKRISKEIEPIQKLIPETFKEYSYGPIDISDYYKKIESHLENYNCFSQALHHFINLPIIKTIDVINEEIKNNKSIIFPFTSTKIIDKYGRVSAVLPSWITASEKGKEFIREHKAQETYGMAFTFILLPFFNSMTSKYDINENSLDIIFESNGFVPKGREHSFKKGLLFGFKGDFISAIPILMPQVEFAVRTLAEECGIVVYKTYDDGTQECLSMDSIINSNEFKDYFTDDFIFNLKVFYTSKYAFGARNNLSHGLYSDAQLQSHTGMGIWWYTLKLCCDFSGSLNREIKKIYSSK